MQAKYINIRIGDKQAVIRSTDDIPLTISFGLEDPDNFQNKTSSNGLSWKLPASLLNDISANQFRNPDSVDLTPNESFRGNQPCVAEANGIELLNGKAFLVNASHSFTPKEYEYNLFGDNADWVIGLQENTLYDFLQHITFTFNKTTIQNSWAYDGTDENLPYVFAPVRYRLPFGGYKTDVANNILQPIDDDADPQYFKPSISKYWILYWALKSLGYRISSTFLDSEYFRRQVMPWTWGNFLQNVNADTHKFLAKGSASIFYNYTFTGYVDVKADDDHNPSTGTFDPNDDYSYDASIGEMKWTYKTNLPYGPLAAGFTYIVNVEDSEATMNSDVELRVRWFKNGTQIQDDLLVNLHGSTQIGLVTATLTIDGSPGYSYVVPGDVITAQTYLHIFHSKFGGAHIQFHVEQISLDYLKVPIGGTISFANFPDFKNYKVLDYFKGVIDEFNLSLNTDSINKVVYIEPTYAYSTTNDLTNTVSGYFKNDFVDWSKKGDYSKEWLMENFSDYERELDFGYKDDTSDGILKTIQDRNSNKLAIARYLFPDRFKAGKKTIENRFFSPTMHYSAEQWKDITSVAPQFVCLIPENISNTSASEAENIFQPKSCYYKGLVSGAGGWKFDGDVQTTFPFMFAVNYHAGGENDPILSYSDENINGNIGKGFLRRYYLQRLAIMRNGQRYNPWFMLKNIDVAGQLHREYKSFAGHRWALILIKDYKPLSEGSTACMLWRWAPIEQRDSDNTYPSSNSVSTGAIPPANSFDLKYAPLKCLTTDIPT